MEPTVDVDEIARRASRHWMEDGLVEIMLGLMFMLMGGGPLVKLVLPRWIALDLLTSALTVASIFGLFWGLKKLKERIVFPRTGYVALPKPGRNRRISVYAVTVLIPPVVVFLAISTKASDREWLSRAAVPGSAVFVALTFLLPALKVKAPRMMWLAVLTLAFGAYLSWFTGLRGAKGVMTLIVLVGVSMAIIGASQLRIFLKANPKPRETEA